MKASETRAREELEAALMKVIANACLLRGDGSRYILRPANVVILVNALLPDILALFSRSPVKDAAPAPVLRERRRDESDLTHLIRCYSEYVRRDESHGPNRCEIANILSCHAPFISEFNDRLAKQAPQPEEKV